MIDVLVVDDHPTMRAGLAALLRREPGIRLAGAVGDAESALREAERVRPDVALVDYHLPDGDGIALCRRLAHLDPAPRTLLFSAFAADALVVPAALAGVAGVLGKEADLDELSNAVRTVASGARLLPPVSPAVRQAVADRLEPDDLPLVGMLLDGTPEDEVASVLGLKRRELEGRVEGLLARLRR